MVITKRSYKVYNDKKTIDILTEKHTFNRCHYCGPPQGKVIMPYDRNAKQMPNGQWKCGTCVHEDLFKTTALLNRGKGIGI